VQTADTVEVTLFRRRLARGATLLRRFVVTRAAGRPSGTVTGSDGTLLTSHDQRPTTDDAVCGTVRLWRHDCTARGPAGHGPLDAELSVPVRCDADLLRE
jgi:glucose/arabinose dehydrogenase